MRSLTPVKLKRPAGRPLKCVSSKNEDFHCELEKNLDFSKIKKNATIKPHLLGEIVSKMKKIYTTFFALLALRAYANYVDRFND